MSGSQYQLVPVEEAPLSQKSEQTLGYKICPYCGSAVPLSAKFCQNCVASIE
ncbi:MAG: zinc-ribbon domain-containing protein [Candidatus Asgardarchaeia archaeon]